MGQPLERDRTASIHDFQFDGGNLPHLARHEVTRDLVWEIWSNDPGIFLNPPSPTRSGTHMIIGPNDEGRFWTIAISEADAAQHIWRDLFRVAEYGKGVTRMARRLTPEEEERLVAEAEAAYESGGYDLSQAQRLRLDRGANPTVPITTRLSLDDARQVRSAARKRGMALDQLLDAAVRSYAGLPEREIPASDADRQGASDREHARSG